MLTNLLGSTFLILAVFLIRLLFREKTGRRFIYALWLIVLVRLLMPVPLFDLGIEPTLPISHDIGAAKDRDFYYPPITSENPDLTEAAPTAENPIPAGSVSPQPAEESFDWTKAFQRVHITGASALALWFGYVNISLYIRLKKDRVRLEAPCSLPVYKTNVLTTPCLFGVIKPSVYLTDAACQDAHMHNVITHEMCHYRHRDNLWNFLGMVCVCLWWFSPLVWLSFFTAKRDGELACDELALEILGETGSRNYGVTLIEMAKNRPHGRIYLTATISGGGKEMKERVKAIANKPKNIIWACLIIVCLMAGCAVIGFSGAEYEKNDVIGKTPAQMLETDTVQKAEQMLSQTIIDHEKGKYMSGLFQTEDHEIIGIEADDEKVPSKITFYLTVLYREYDFDHEKSEPIGVAGGRSPTAVTFEVKDNKVTLFDYWTPLDGEGYDTSIREKFPEKYWNEAFDHAGGQAQEARCFEKAVKHFADSTPDEEIDALFNEIISSPTEYSDTASYISAHKNEYEKLLKLDKYTLSYAFRGFEAVSFDGLKAEIIASVCADIIKAESENVPEGKYDERYRGFLDKGYGNAYNWYTEAKDFARQLLNDKGIEEVEKYDRWAELLLSIADNMSAYTPALIKDFDGVTMVVDPIEYITPDDTERIAELELDADFDLVNGYYIHNETEENIPWKVGEGAVFEIVDWNRQFTQRDSASLFYVTESTDEFLEYCSSYDGGMPTKTPFFFILDKNGSIIKLQELILP